MSRPAATVIIPNHNGAHLLPTCLNALCRQTYRDFGIVVVDNGSRDGSTSLLARDYPDVKVIKLPTNQGFSRAVNEGIRKSSGEVVVLLNNDTEPEPAWLEELIQTLAQNPDVGAVSSKLLFFDKRHVLHTAGDYFVLDGMPGNRGVWEEDRGQYDADLWIFGACGAAAAYRRSMLDEIGLFDEDFFAYCEDVDMAWRAQLAGYRCLFVPGSRVYHRVSATGGGTTANYFWGRNVIYVLAKDYPASLLRKYWWPILKRQLGVTWELLGQWREGVSRARLKGQLAGVVSLPWMLRKRRTVQRLRRVSDAYLESLLHPQPTGQPGRRRVRQIFVSSVARVAPSFYGFGRRTLWVIRITGWRALARMTLGRVADLVLQQVRASTGSNAHDGRLAKALFELSSVYLYRLDLQEAYPQPRGSPNRGLLEWAVMVACGRWQDSDRVKLQSYVAEYHHVLSLLQDRQVSRGRLQS